MKSCTFRFYEEINDFLPEHLQKIPFEYCFFGTPTVKDAIEAIGIPHPEIDLIIVDKTSVAFDYPLQGNERIAVYPVFEAIDISPVIHLNPAPLRKTSFLVDRNLGKLARYLRMFGFDALFDATFNDEQIMVEALEQERIILSRNKSLLKRKEVMHGYWVRSTHIDKQVPEIFKRFDLKNNIEPFTRCMLCNGLLKSIKKDQVQSKLPENVKNNFDEFYYCYHCQNIYWQGSHYENMLDKIESITSDD